MPQNSTPWCIILAMTDHYFSSRERADFEPIQFSFTFNDHDFHWIGSRGVFSSKAFDKGSQLMLSCFLEDNRSENAHVLDLGCGTGVVGVLLAHFIQDISVTCSDVSAAATVCTARNVREKALLYRVQVAQGQGTTHFRDATFTHVLLNPPIRAGNEVIFELIEGSARTLQPGGKLYMVVRVKQGGKRIAELSKQWFGSIEQIGRKKGFLVYRLSK